MSDLKDRILTSLKSAEECAITISSNLEYIQAETVRGVVSGELSGEDFMEIKEAVENANLSVKERSSSKNS